MNVLLRGGSKHVSGRAVGGVWPSLQVHARTVPARFHPVASCRRTGRVMAAAVSLDIRVCTGPDGNGFLVFEERFLLASTSRRRANVEIRGQMVER